MYMNRLHSLDVRYIKGPFYSIQILDYNVDQRISGAVIGILRTGAAARFFGLGTL